MIFSVAGSFYSSFNGAMILKFFSTLHFKRQWVWIEFSVCFDFYSLLLCTIFKPINSCQYLPTLWHHQDLESDRLKMRIPMHLKYYSNENRGNP